MIFLSGFCTFFFNVFLYNNFHLFDYLHGVTPCTLFSDHTVLFMKDVPKAFCKRMSSKMYTVSVYTLPTKPDVWTPAYNVYSHRVRANMNKNLLREVEVTHRSWSGPAVKFFSCNNGRRITAKRDLWLKIFTKCGCNFVVSRNPVKIFYIFDLLW